MKPFVVLCPACDQKDIIELRKKLKTTQQKCRRCHKNTWLRVIGEIEKFGDRGQYTKIKLFPSQLEQAGE